MAETENKSTHPKRKLPPQNPPRGLAAVQAMNRGMLRTCGWRKMLESIEGIVVGLKIAPELTGKEASEAVEIMRQNSAKASKKASAILLKQAQLLEDVRRLVPDDERIDRFLKHNPSVAENYYRSSI